MDFLPTWLLSNGIFLLLFVALWVFVLRTKKRNVAALGEKLKPEAARHGWTVHTEIREGARVVRWTGQNEGVRWISEDIYRKRQSRHHSSVVSIARWQTVGMRATSSAIVLMGLPEGTQVPKAAAPAEGLLASLALKAVTYALDKGFDGYFGEEIGKQIDAARLKRVDQVEPLLDGFAVMAEDPAEAARVITNGVAQAVRATISQGPASLDGVHRPWILIWSRGVVVARMAEAESAAGLEPIIRAGVAIARAARF